jgi:two-component system, NarL family, response regulator NreC
MAAPPSRTHMSLRVLLADDHAVALQAIKAVLESEGLEVVGGASNGQDAVRQCRQLQPEVAILDISMPLLNGIEAAREIVRICPNTVVVMLSDHTEDLYVWESLRAGAKGYVLKADTAAELARAVYSVSRGKTYISPSVPSRQKAWPTGTQPAGPLGARERQVIRLMAEGKSTKEIADILDIGCETVWSHRKHIMKKLDIHDTAGLVRYAINHGLLGA